MQEINTFQELFDYVTPEYEKIIEGSKKDSHSRLNKKLDKLAMDTGICDFLKERNITLSKRIQDVFDNISFLFAGKKKEYWFDPPYSCNSKQDAIRSLRKRVFILNYLALVEYCHILNKEDLFESLGDGE